MSNFGEYLKERRKNLKMTMSDVQTVAGISQPSMSLYEKGTKVPSKKTLVKLADLYDVSHEEMIQRAEDAKDMTEPIEKPEKVVVKPEGETIHRFKCVQEHIFYLPINIDNSIEDLIALFNAMQCPICHCRGKDIKFNMRNKTIIEV